jgi:hypothetical protein
MLRTLSGRARTAAFALALVLAAGCGDRNLVLDVDVLSYLDPADTEISFGPIPPVPGGLVTGEIAVVEDVTVNLLEKPGDFARVHSATLTIAATVHDSTGGGSDTLRVYMSDLATDPRATPPVAVLAAALSPGQTGTFTVNVDADARVVELFDSPQMRLTVTNSLRGPASGEPLNGRLELSAIRAIVLANRQGK